MNRLDDSSLLKNYRTDRIAFLVLFILYVVPWLPHLLGCRGDIVDPHCAVPLLEPVARTFGGLMIGLAFSGSLGMIYLLASPLLFFIGFRVIKTRYKLDKMGIVSHYPASMYISPAIVLAVLVVWFVIGIL